MKQGIIWKDSQLGFWSRSKADICTRIATDVAVVARHSFNTFSRYTLRCIRKKSYRNKICFIWILDLPSSSMSNRASGKQVLGSRAPSLMDQSLILWEEAVGRSFPLSCRSTC